MRGAPATQMKAPTANRWALYFGEAVFSDDFHG
jgi:hypothetical protein